MLEKPRAPLRQTPLPNHTHTCNFISKSTLTSYRPVGDRINVESAFRAFGTDDNPSFNGGKLLNAEAFSITEMNTSVIIIQ